MRRPRWPRTATVQLAAVYAGVFAVAAFSLIGFFDWTVTSYARGAIATDLADEMQVLQNASRRGMHEVLEQVQQKQTALGDKEHIYFVSGPDGSKLIGHLPASAAKLGRGRWQRPAPTDAREFDDETETVETLGERLPDGGLAVVGVSTYAYHELREQLLAASGVSAVGVVLVALAIAFIVSRRFLARIERVNDAAARIMGGSFDARLPTIGMGEEFDRLAANLNHMLDRIETLMESLRQVSSDIAHDLRTPLTRLRQGLEAALAGEGENPDRDVLARQTLAQIDEILATFTALLRIGQVEGGSGRDTLRTVDLSTLAARVADAYAPAAEDQGKRITLDIALNVFVAGDEELLTQLISNLIENALVHAEGPGAITLTLEQGGERATLSVSDRGRGIPETERERVLRRFFRLDAARSTPGAGLGLAMVSAIVQLHDAGLRLSDNAPGLRVDVSFPIGLQPNIGK
jgi:signal transduction histidine kinase